MTRLNLGLVVSGLSGWLVAGWVAVPALQAAQDAYNLKLDSAWIQHVEETLARSALNGGNRHGREASIDRSIHDVGYFLHQADKAAQRADRLAAERNAKQALELLHRSVQKGYFRPEDVERIVPLIKQHLPGVAI
ncbi:MAG TPA: hypothetical protein VNK46_11780 [Nitrospiraceae bacterium]|nr:hypothetical protein [Nitrospiraceae bacterium]